MRTILSTPHGDLTVTDAVELRRVEESLDASDRNPADVLAMFLASNDCQMFLPDDVQRYKLEFVEKSKGAYVRFRSSYDPWRASVELTRDMITLIGGAGGIIALFLGIASLGIGSVAWLFGAEWSTGLLSLSGVLAITSLILLGFWNLGGRLHAWLREPSRKRFEALAQQSAQAQWIQWGLDAFGPVPNPVRDLATQLMEAFHRSPHLRDFRLVTWVDAAVAIPDCNDRKVLSRAAILDPFLVVSVVSRTDNSCYASAAVAVWDEKGFVATLHHPTSGSISDTV